jgi:outer membrane murein-binding lipoprotein Lpp
MTFLVEVAAVAGAYVAGCVSPAVGRKLKAEVAKLKGDVKADVSKVEADAKAEVKKV